MMGEFIEVENFGEGTCGRWENQGDCSRHTKSQVGIVTMWMIRNKFEHIQH